MINQIKLDIIVHGNGHYDVISSWFWAETKKQMIYSQPIGDARNNAWDRWSLVYDNVVARLVAIKTGESSYFSYILRDLKK